MKTPRKPASGIVGKTSKKDMTDKELWKAFTSRINQMSDLSRNYNISSIKASSPNRKTQAVLASPSIKPKKPQAIAPKTTGVLEHGQADGLDRVSRKNMRRGKVTLEGRLDLHGMVQTDAHRSLLSFLERAYLSGKRSVLVITGKGQTKNGEIGVLRRAVPRWLNEQPMKLWIRGFDYAAPADGGEGALYILLRRKR